MKNYRTFLAGLLAGLPTAIDALVNAYNAGYFTGKSGSQLAAGIGFVLLGLLAKDKVVTGVGYGAETKAEFEKRMDNE